MRIKILLFSIGLLFCTYAWSLPPSLHLTSDKQRLAHESARIFQEEANNAKAGNYPLVVVIPTGSTAIPFYQQIVRLYLEGQLDFSQVALFNMDEYVGQSQADYSQSYNAFMEQYLYRFIRNKPDGIHASNLHIPTFTTKLEQAYKVASAYGEDLRQAIAQPNARFIVFGGIGVSPAHVAFNDLTTESFYDDQSMSIAQKNQAAKKLPTRVVTLDEQTSQTNQVKLTHAITVGFAELLKADRTIIMANSTSKRQAIEDALCSVPDYCIPASLLSDGAGEVEFWISPESMSDRTAQKALGIEPAARVASLLETSVVGINQVKPDLQKRALFVRYDNSAPWPSYWVKKYPKSHQITVSTAEQIEAQMHHFQPSVVVLPLAHDERTRQIEGTIQSVLDKNQATWGKTLLVYFDTDAGLLSRYNYLMALNAEQEARFEQARNQHVSQVRRTTFAEIPKRKAHELLKIAGTSFKAPANAVGLEGYFVSTLDGAEINDFSPESFSEEARLIVIAPHPDDAEIGAAGLIDCFAQTPTQIWTMTEGHHAAVSVDDVLDNPNMPKSLVQAALKQKDLGHELIQDERLKAAIRHQESSLAVHLLAKNHKHPEKVMALALPFYDNDYQATVEDENLLLQNMKGLSTVPQIVLAVPFADDEHIAHRIARELALKLFTRWQQAHPEQEITLVAYPTPWTGRYRLYDYNNQGSVPDAIIGAERLQGKGLAGNLLWTQLGQRSATRYQVQQIGKAS